jgi:hypothetical protein
VWHASVSAAPGYPAVEHFLRRYALDALIGVGDAALGQWEEWSGLAYHVKRRLTPREQRHVGEALDIRGTSEAVLRRAAVQKFLPEHMRGWEE